MPQVSYTHYLLNFRKMYWSDWGAFPKIEQANMDGTSRTTFVSSGLSWVNALALDYKNKLLYWCDAQLDKIERVNLQGNNRVVILDLSSGNNHHPFGLALYENALFWTDWSTKNVHKYNMTSSVSEVLVRGMGRPMEIHIYDSRTLASGMRALIIVSKQLNVNLRKRNRTIIWKQKS